MVQAGETHAGFGRDVIEAVEEGLVGGAGQRRLVRADAGQQRGDALHVHGLTVVAGAEQGDVGVVQPMALRGLRDQGHGLKGFQR
ncbi:hypothetical protein D9M69_702760 [compost metagenome]